VTLGAWEPWTLRRSSTPTCRPHRRAPAVGPGGAGRAGRGGGPSRWLGEHSNHLFRSDTATDEWRWVGVPARPQRCTRVSKPAGQSAPRGIRTPTARSVASVGPSLPVLLFPSRPRLPSPAAMPAGRVGHPSLRVPRRLVATWSQLRAPLPDLASGTSKVAPTAPATLPPACGDNTSRRIRPDSPEGPLPSLRRGRAGRHGHGSDRNRTPGGLRGWTCGAGSAGQARFNQWDRSSMPSGRCVPRRIVATVG
jgi:hypothetical protein